MAHGNEDGLVPFEIGVAAVAALRDGGAAVEFQEFSMGHTLDLQELEALRQFLQRVLPGEVFMAPVVGATALIGSAASTANIS